MKLNLPRLIAEKSRLLKRAGIEQGPAEVELILCHLLNADRVTLYLHGDRLLTDDHLLRLDDILKQRMTRYPLQYILGEAWFYGRRFEVSPAVMVPTPETELLCDSAVRFIRSRQKARPYLLDLGVGCGVIAITMAKELPGSRVLGIDISADAITVARRNAETLAVGDRTEFRPSDLFDAVAETERFDLILSNPPYIAEPDYDDLPPEVLADPKIAMTAGADGLDVIRRVLHQAPPHLAPGGRLLFEIGYNQAEEVARITEADDRYTSMAIVKDLNDIDRVVMLSCD